jgi:hypothetical protein
VKHPVTPDGRYFGVRGRLCRMAKPDLDEADRADLVGRLMAARRAVRDPKKWPIGGRCHWAKGL